jgi:hypothetical protein
MAVITPIYLSKIESANVTMDERIQKNLKTTDYEILEIIENDYSFNAIVKCFEGQVISTQSCNLAYFDDYRPGVKITVFDGEIKHIHNSCECPKSSAKVDASEDVITAYENMVAYNLRKVNVIKRLQQREQYMEDGKAIGMTYHKAKKLHQVFDHDQYNEAIKLLKSFINERIRSEFRMSLASQIFHWLNDPNPKYNKPLSPNQVRFLRPYKPY